MLVGIHDLPPVTGENRRVHTEEDESSAAGQIHDDAAAAEYGFKGAVVHGIRVLEAAMHPVYDRWGLDWFDGGRAVLRHRRPVYEGTQLTAEFTGGPEQFGLIVRDPDGEQPAVGSITAPTGRPLPPIHVPPPVPIFAEKIKAEQGAVVVGAPVIGVPTLIDDALLHQNVLERDSPYVEGEPILSASLHVQLAGAAVFETYEYVTPGMHYAADTVYRAPVRFGSTVRSTGCMVETFQRNGNDYFVAQFVLADEEQVLAVVRQTVLYHMVKKGS